MASFIAKQLVGKQLDAVKGAVGKGEEKSDEDKTKDEEAALELAEQRREEEEKRRERHRRMEAEREVMRQSIRDKYGLKKKEELASMDDPSRAGQIGRKRKTPEELAAEARGESPDNEGFIPTNISEMTAKISEAPGQLASQVQEKCLLM